MGWLKPPLVHHPIVASSPHALSTALFAQLLVLSPTRPLRPSCPLPCPAVRSQAAHSLSSWLTYDAHSPATPPAHLASNEVLLPPSGDSNEGPHSCWQWHLLCQHNLLPTSLSPAPWCPPLCLLPSLPSKFYTSPPCSPGPPNVPSTPSTNLRRRAACPRKRNTPFS